MHGSGFDAMNDMKYLNGQPYMNDFIFVSREMSDAVRDRLIAAVRAVDPASESASSFYSTFFRAGVVDGEIVPFAHPHQYGSDILREVFETREY